MTAREGFGVLVRFAGLMTCAYGLRLCCIALSISRGLWNSPNLPDVDVYLFGGIPAFLLGLYLLRGAPHLVNFAYSKENH
jgi:hypothetical protein